MVVHTDILDQQDLWAVNNCGFGAKRGYGKTPALLVVDAQYNFTGENLPLNKSMKTYPAGIGQEAWRTVEHTQKVLRMARRKQIPVIFTRSVRSDKDKKFDSFRKKRKIEATKKIHDKNNGVEIVDTLAPLEDEQIIDKKYASAFFATPMESILRSYGIDTLIVTGFVTSGCIRATVVDAASYNYNVIIPEECINDRITISHKINLLDMDLKYADVVSLDDVLNYLNMKDDSYD